jgi:hypothetical protein
MYGVAGETRPIFSESDAFLYNLGDPIIVYFVLNPSLITSLPFWVDRILSIRQMSTLRDVSEL